MTPDKDAPEEPVRRLWQSVEGPLTYALNHPGRVHGFESFLRARLENMRSSSPRAEDLYARLVPLVNGLDGAAPEGRAERLQGFADLVAQALLPPQGAPDRPAAEVTTGGTAASKSSLTASTPIQYVKGVGPARAVPLEKIGIATVGDALEHLPRRYEDRREIRPIPRVRTHRVETVSGVIRSGEVVTTPRRRMKIFEAVVDDGRGRMTVKWFNQAYLKKTLKPGTKVVLTGPVKPAYRGGGAEMENPEYEVIAEDEPHIHTKRIVPIYPLTEGLSARGMRTLLHRLVVETPPDLEDCLPEEMRTRLGLPGIGEALSRVHFPPADADLEQLNGLRDPWRRRLAFEELFILETGLARIHSGHVAEKGIAFSGAAPRLDRLIGSLPFSLTAAQKRVVGEIRGDMVSGRSMHRLIQGDVGCGKTLVALAAILIAIDSGYQAALMAPTEILAEQHYENIRQYVEPLGVAAGLYTSGTKTCGSVNDVALVVGTHALIQEQVGFERLGLAVVDEQHRFGVAQRARLREKGENPDVLVMTATPIPRTLCLTLYGDLDVSIVDELPPGRTPVRTSVLMPSRRESVFKELEKELAQGRQAYVVYPLVEESESMDLKSATEGFEEMKQRFPDHDVGLLHGKMKPDLKASVMDGFKKGRTGILVATTVIEVGVDVPNATVMLVEHAERFGLSQLHQLRGRVGRGSSESRCVLIAYPPLSDEGRRRLKVMEETNDGFRIAEADLDIRGPGEFFGTRQSGMPDLRVAHLLRDMDLLESARKEAFDLVARDPDLSTVPLVKEALRRRWPERLKNIRTG